MSCTKTVLHQPTVCTGTKIRRRTIAATGNAAANCHQIQMHQYSDAKSPSLLHPLHVIIPGNHPEACYGQCRSNMNSTTENLYDQKDTAISTVSVARLNKGPQHLQRQDESPLNYAQFCFYSVLKLSYLQRTKCADTTGTVLVPWAGHFQC